MADKEQDKDEFRLLDQPDPVAGPGESNVPLDHPNAAGAQRTGPRVDPDEQLRETAIGWEGGPPVGRDGAAAPPPRILPPGPPRFPPNSGGGGLGGDLFTPGSDANMRLMSYSQHLEELRGRLIKAVISIVIGVCIAFFFTDMVFELLKSRAEGVTLIRTGVAEMIGTYVKVAFVCGLVLATPVWLYQLIMFIAPGLVDKEKRFLYLSLPAVCAAFVVGVLFGYFLLLPPALNFLVHFKEDLVTPLIRVGDYVDVVTTMLFWIGVIFETPIVIFVLARLGIVTPDFLKQHRAHAAVIAFVLAAIITPTVDPVNQALVAVPIILLYEIGILLSYIAVKARVAATK